MTYKELAVPLHLPTSRLREAASQTLSGFLHNYQKYECLHRVQDPAALTCSCSQLIAKIRNYDSSIHCFGANQHVAVELQELNLPLKLRIFQTANASSTFFLASRNFRRFGMNTCNIGLSFTAALHSPMTNSKLNFFDSGPPTPMNCETILDSPSRTSSTFFKGYHKMWSFIMLIMKFIASLCFVLVSTLTLPAARGMILNFFLGFLETMMML